MRAFILLASFWVLGGVAMAADPAQSFAVLELFTSEGCPSCPAAEAVLQRIQDRAIEQDEPVYALAFHVDYFDTEDWKDRYAQPSHAQRQRNYRAVWRESHIYTPQLVVNGQTGFVGSDSDEADKRIRKAMESAPKTTVAMQVVSVKDNAGKLIQLMLQPSVEGSKGAVLHIALVEDGLAADDRGHAKEGDPVVLRNGVVRSFWSVPVKKLGGQFLVEWPQDVDPKKSSLIVYAQSTVTLRIQGALRVQVP